MTLMEVKGHQRSNGENYVLWLPYLVKRSAASLEYITRIRRFMDLDTCNNIVRSLILSRLDYGNALLLGSNVSSISRLQKFQNWAAKLIFCAAKQDHATPFLKKTSLVACEGAYLF